MFQTEFNVGILGLISSEGSACPGSDSVLYAAEPVFMFQEQSLPPEPKRATAGGASPLCWYPEGGWRGDRRCAILQTPYVNIVAPPPLERHWASVAERRAAIGCALAAGCFLVVKGRRRF